MNALVKPLTWILGIVLLLVGVAGFFTGSPLIVFAVDPLHNIIHILSGVAALFAASSGYAYARLYLILFGLVYGLVAVVGFVQGTTVLGLITVNMEDNWLHTAIAVACLAVGLGSKK